MKSAHAKPTWRRGPVAGLIVLSLAFPATAQFETTETGQDGAEAIRKGITDYLAQFASSLPDDISLVLQGPVDVTVEDQTYAAAVPELALRNEDGEDRYELTLGPTLSTITPLGDNRLAATMTLSEELLGQRNGSPAFSVKWLNRAADVTLHTAFGFFETADIVLEDVRVTDAETSYDAARIGQVALAADVDDPAADRIDGSFNLSVEDVTFIDAFRGPVLTIGGAQFDVEGRETDVSRYPEMQALFEDLQAREIGSNPLSEREARTIADQLISFIDIADGFSETIAINDFNVETDQGPGGFDFAGAGLSLDGLTSDDVRFGMNADVLASYLPIAGPYEIIVPTRARSDLAVGQIPMPLFRDVVEEIIVGMLTDATSAEMGDQLDDHLSRFMASDAVLDINAIIIEFSDSAIFSEGQFQVDESARYKATGNVAVRLVGMENLIDKVRSLPDEGPQIAAFLAIIQAMGAQEEGANGLGVRRYELELTADGTALLNGADIGPILDQFF